MEAHPEVVSLCRWLWLARTTSRWRRTLQQLLETWQVHHPAWRRQQGRSMCPSAASSPKQSGRRVSTHPGLMLCTALCPVIFSPGAFF